MRETLPVFIIGFPIGFSLGTSDRFPEPTVGTGTICSFRLDDSGEVFRIQIDGDPSPGNSGGPIVDARGALVRIAAATIQGPPMSMAIPPDASSIVRILSFPASGSSSKGSRF